MLLNSPGADLINPRLLKLMTALGRVEVPMTGRQLARVTGIDRTTTSKLLGDLAEAGVLRVLHVAPALQYSPNRDHFYWQLFETLRTFRARLEEQLATLLPTEGDAAHQAVFIFGSYTRGEAHADSDIDVAVIVGTDAQAVTVEDRIYSGFADGIEAWTGNRLGPFVTTWSQLQAMVAAGDPLVDSWARDGHYVAGAQPQDLLEAAGWVDTFTPVEQALEAIVAEAEGRADA